MFLCLLDQGLPHVVLILSFHQKVMQKFVLLCLIRIFWVVHIILLTRQIWHHLKHGFPISNPFHIVLKCQQLCNCWKIQCFHFPIVFVVWTWSTLHNVHISAKIIKFLAVVWLLQFFFPLLHSFWFCSNLETSLAFFPFYQGLNSRYQH